mmetsp:Transcript_26210/g.52685  ORF Transcript_26210/g.52685 Transcript_26210/m.52685 type:complete len:669 (+) Transcript_26210:162-2168(+)
MNDPRDGNDDEAAARLIQENLWLAEHAGEEGAPDVQAERLRLLLEQRRGQDFGDDDEQQGNEGGEGAEEAGDGEDPEEAAIDGGVAGDVKEESGVKITRSKKCPLLLYFDCDENLDELSPDNPILKRGVSVYIGLDKNTKLEKVFARYCEIVNSNATSNVNHVKMDDFEFLHTTILDKTNTVEASAMMKNDHIKVHRERSKDRAIMLESIRLQRESDRKYFENLRQLLPNLQPEGTGCDVILDCKGKVVDERGYRQNVLATTVRANSVLLSKRCKWLGQKILYAREEKMRVDEVAASERLERRNRSTSSSLENRSLQQSDGEDDVVPAFPQIAGRDNVAVGNQHHAAEIEDDEDDDEITAKNGESSGTPNGNPCNGIVQVTLDHPPEAVKLLLEYCYTNRVHSLGHEAFTKASRYADPKDVGFLAAKDSGPVSPFKKHSWPNGGLPDVSLHVALAGIALAEEAHMPRLSLMCEIAASQLVDPKNVIDVLSACQLQQQKTGNRLPLLRKAAILDCVMANGSVGVEKLYESTSFKTNLEEKSSLVIPSLLEGAVEVLPTNMKTKEFQKKKDKMSEENEALFRELDKCDNNERANERARWRSKATVDRRVEVAFGPDEISEPLPYLAFSSTVNSGRGPKRKGRSGSGDGDFYRGVIARRNIRRKITKKDGL